MAIIKDSSIWESNSAFSTARDKDMSVRIGMVREAKYSERINATQYVVEVFDKNNQMPVICTRVDTFGGAYNYDEHTFRENIVSDTTVASASRYAVRPGDVVIVAFANGDSREGLILGGVKHPARKEKISKADGIAHKQEFNGLEKHVNKVGEYKVTFKGLPTNIAQLEKQTSGNDVPEPVYDTAVGGSYYQFDKTGSWTLSDVANEKPQTIKVDKPSGKITIVSGNVSITIDKNAELIDVVTKDLKITASNSIKKNTKEFTLEATTFTKIKTPKVAIGTDGIELLDQLIKLIEGIGRLVIMSPIGPCAPVVTARNWQLVETVKKNINTIKGSL